MAGPYSFKMNPLGMDICFQSFVIINKAAMNSLIILFAYEPMYLQGNFLEMQLLAQRACTF